MPPSIRPHRAVVPLALVLLIGVLPGGCADGPSAPEVGSQPAAPSAAAQHAEVPHGPDGTPTAPTTTAAYEALIAQIELKGASGAQVVWDAGKPAVLLFSASW